ncbi:DUF4199 domain-containing protein [Maribacter sp. 2307ULW6-5]|uniref:DUF4199 domain-containing protein n=1 Tax=Maribacter sp. 2307ULW6-5 TaxID=3386275 RepID=UPI0039BD6D11
MKNLKIEVKWAIIFSIMGLLWMLLEKLFGLHGTHIDKHMYLTNLFAIPAIIVMVLALKDKKKNYYSGQMNYKQGLISGILLSLFIALLSPLTQWITSTIITPEFFPNVIAHSVKTGYHASVEAAQAYFNLKNYMVQSTIAALVMGIVTTAVAMLFIRTKKNV